MGPIESIRSVTNTKPKSVLSMLTRQFTSTTTSQKDKNNNLNIKSLKKQETPLSESQKLQNPAYNKTLSQTINLDNMPVYDSSPIVNLNINDGITEADFDEINITDSGKLINCNIQQSSITTKDSTNAVESKSTKIKQSDVSRAYLNTDNNMYESFKNNPSKGINSNFNTQSSLKNTIYTNNYNINALSQTIRVNNPSSNCNTNNSDDYNLKNTVYNSNPYMNNYNSSNYHSLKLSNNTAQNVKESRDENPNDLSKKRIITHEIRLSKDLDNFNSSLDLTKLKNFPENVKTIKIVEKVITNNNKNNSTENNTEDNSKMNDESEPYVKKKIVKKMIQFKDGSSEVVFYEK